MADESSMPEGVDKLMLLSEIEAFLVAELALLDNGDLPAWRELFTDEGTYWAPARPDQENPLDEISLFYDDKNIMAVRAERLAQPRDHGRAPLPRTSHMISNVEIAGFEDGGARLEVRARFHMLEYRPEMEQRSFGGLYEYSLVRETGGFRIAAKKATVINCDGAFYPLAMPF